MDNFPLDLVVRWSPKCPLRHSGQEPQSTDGKSRWLRLCRQSIGGRACSTPPIGRCLAHASWSNPFTAA